MKAQLVLIVVITIIMTDYGKVIPKSWTISCLQFPKYIWEAGSWALVHHLWRSHILYTFLSWSEYVCDVDIILGFFEDNAVSTIFLWYRGPSPAMQVCMSMTI